MASCSYKQNLELDTIVPVPDDVSSTSSLVVDETFDSFTFKDFLPKRLKRGGVMAPPKYTKFK